MKTLFAPLMGRFGNQISIWAHAKAVCERDGLELCCGPWIGEEVFDISKSRRVSRPDVVLPADYHQRQESAIYTRSQVKQWLKVKPHIWELMEIYNPDELLAHRRVGDYAGKDSCFPVISKYSYIKAVDKFGFDYTKLAWITEENPTPCPALHKDLQFMADFIHMMRAKVLFRGNSTFSYWAGVLGDSMVYAPIVKGRGLLGGKECEVDYVEGNHPACSDFDFVSDIHLQ